MYSESSYICTEGHHIYVQRVSIHNIVVLVGTKNGDDNACPTGYYCPAQSPLPIPCPVGMYGNVIRATKSDDCVLCPSDTYNNLLGQVSVPIISIA